LIIIYSFHLNDKENTRLYTSKDNIIWWKNYN